MNLERFFKENGKAAIAFSDGVDSADLLYAACCAAGTASGQGWISSQNE